MIWQQIYNPAGNMVVSTALAAAQGRRAKRKGNRPD